RGRHRRRRRPRRTGRHGGARGGGPPRDLARTGARTVVGRAGLLVVRRPLSRQLAGTAPARGSRLAGAGATGLDGHGRFRSARRPLAPPVGRGLRGLRRRRETVMAALARYALLPGRRLGGARWLHTWWPGVAAEGWWIRVRGARRGRDVGWTRRESGAGPYELARETWRSTAADAERCAGPR